MLAPKISELIHFVKDDENYDALIDLSYIRNSYYLDAWNLSGNPYNEMRANRKFIEDFYALEKNSTYKAEHLLKLGKEFSFLRRKLNIADESLICPASTLNIISCILLLFFFIPYFVFSVIISSPITLISQFIIYKIEDKAFNNSIRYVLSILLTPIILIILVPILFSVTKWYIAILILLLSIPSFSFSHKYVRLLRIVISDIKLKTNKSIKTLVKSINDYLK